jgi:hypothetical protein
MTCGEVGNGTAVLRKPEALDPFEPEALPLDGADRVAARVMAASQRRLGDSALH